MATVQPLNPAADLLAGPANGMVVGVVATVAQNFITSQALTTNPGTTGTGTDIRYNLNGSNELKIPTITLSAGSSFTILEVVPSIAVTGGNHGIWGSDVIGNTFCVIEGNGRRPWVRVNGTDVYRLNGTPTGDVFPADGSSVVIAYKVVSGGATEIWWNGVKRHFVSSGTPTTPSMLFNGIGYQWSSFTTIGPIQGFFAWNRALSDTELADYTSNPWAMFAGGSTNGNASGNVPSLTLVPATGAATGTAPNGNASGNVPSLTLVPATGTATGTTVGNGNASGSVPSLTLVPATGTATGTAPNGNASGSVPSLTLVPATGTATGTTAGNGNASGSVPSLTLVPATGTATGTAPNGNASGSVPSLTLVPATGTATGTTAGNGSASGSVPSLTLIPATGFATSVGNGNASGSVPSLTLIPATGFASSVSVGSIAVEVRPPKKTIISHFDKPYYGGLFDDAIHNPLRMK